MARSPRGDYTISIREVSFNYCIKETEIGKWQPLIADKEYTDLDFMVKCTENDDVLKHDNIYFTFFQLKCVTNSAATLWYSWRSQWYSVSQAYTVVQLACTVGQC